MSKSHKLHTSLALIMVLVASSFVWASDSQNAQGDPSLSTCPRLGESPIEARGFKEKEFFAVIVGAGLSGAVMAERIASQLGKKVLVIDKRDHLAGNCYDYTDSGIRVSKYGPHYFHTDDEEVWSYVNKFSTWRRYDLKNMARVYKTLPNGEKEPLYVPVPANINTVNTLFDLNLRNESDFRSWISKERVGKEEDAKNSEDVALARVGRRLFDGLFRDYTIKQWNKSASELEPSVLKRIPARENFDDRYFSDKYQALPSNGYTDWIKSILNNPLIEVVLNTNYFCHKAALDGLYSHAMIYTGPIDHFFAGEGLPKLEYRSINFHFEKILCDGYLQPNVGVNYPDMSTIATRTTEYKHIFAQKSNYTILVTEYSTDQGDPYYPVPTERNRNLYAEYQQLAANREKEDPERKVIFLGRLANYKYINMDQAVRFALDSFAKNFLSKV